MRTNSTLTGLATAFSLAIFGLLSGCTPMVAGQMAEGGYSAAKSALGALNPTTTGGDERQRVIPLCHNRCPLG